MLGARLFGFSSIMLCTICMNYQKEKWFNVL